MKNKVILSAITFGVVGVGTIGATSAFAQGKTPHTSNLVQKIADKFGLKKEEVQAVFDQDRTDHRKIMETNYELRLQQYVKDGKITETQKQLLINKHKELQSQIQTTMTTMKDKTIEERKTIMQKQKTDLENWAKQNNIDLKYLFGRFGLGMKDRGMMHWHKKK